MSLPSRGAWIEMVSSGAMNVFLILSLPSRGAWIEITPRASSAEYWLQSLPSRGAWIEIVAQRYQKQKRPSLPSRGAWIEIGMKISPQVMHLCRSPRGERGLKSVGRPSHRDWQTGRSPRGERGLKWASSSACTASTRSLPSRGAWIEIACQTD